jgi:PAS domain S-box-containing protein
MQRNIGDVDEACNHVGVFWLIRYWIVTSCVAIVLLSCTPLSASSVPEKNVLVLYSWPLRSTSGELETLKETVRLRISAPVDFYVEYLESQRFGSAGYQQALVETIRQSYDFTGGNPKTGLGDTWTAFIHPDDLGNVQTANSRALKEQKGFSKEYRLRRKDGVYRWILDVAAPRINSDGSFAGFIGSANDVTDQKLTQEALEKVGGRLIEAQEKERNRIARELHDDICQSLTLMSLELHQAHQDSNGTDARTKERLFQIRQHCSEIAGDVQALSHQLHSSKLDYLGVVAAVGSFCREFSQQHNVQVEFTQEDVPKTLPKDVSLTLFRVTQEALQNALKYSGVSRFAVDLRGRSDRIRLEISDAGVGFAVDEARRDRGLGLVSMQERVHLVNGAFSLESKLNGGTRVVVFVPLVAEMKAYAMDTGNS